VQSGATPPAASAERLFAAEISRFEVLSGGDQTHVAERLREVPEQLAGAWVDLLGQEPDVVREAAGVLEERLGSFTATRPREAADKPERADDERSLAAAETVVGAVAKHQPLLDELALDRVEGGKDALVIRRKKADQRYEQRGGVELVGVERLG
jgi:hypothetical protein